MTKSDKPSEMPSKQLSKKIIWALIIIALIGFIDASYLTITHFTGADVNCSITGGCDAVLSSKYAVIFGIPMSALGLLYYTGIFLLSLTYLELHNKLILKVLTFLTASGFLFSLWLVYLQLFVIEEICQYCMLSAISSTILMILGTRLIKHWNTKNA